MSTSVRIDEAGIVRLGQTAVMPMLVRVANRVANNSAARVPVDTGYLRSSRAITEDPGRLAVRVAYRARYARFVHDGARGRRGRPFLADALREETERL